MNVSHVQLLQAIRSASKNRTAQRAIDLVIDILNGVPEELLLADLMRLLEAAAREDGLKSETAPIPLAAIAHEV